MASKVCFKCGIEKPLTDFYAHPRMADGHLNKCKECTKKDVKENRDSNHDYYLRFDRIRGKSPARLEKQRAYRATERGKEVNRISHARTRSKYPERYRARTILGNAVRDGRITPLPCEVCGSTDRIEAHHDDYSRPLDVRWLCSLHHRQHHGHSIS